MVKLGRRRHPNFIRSNDPTGNTAADERSAAVESPEDAFWLDLHHHAMTASWPRFFFAVASVFVIFNLVFASLYAAGDRPIANAAPGDFFALFFFSVETMGTVGYGDMHPQTGYAHLIASAEIFTGACSLAVVTGVIFARFSQPRARIVFAANPVIAPHDGARTLMLRFANARRNMITNASAKLWVVRDERTAEGSIFRRFHRLKLERDDNPVFIYTWTIMHVIDETSPLHGAHTDNLGAMGTSFVVTVSGLDERSSEFLHARKSYQAKQVLVDRDYVDIVQRDTGGGTWIDYSKFHLTREVGSASSIDG